MEKSGLKTMTTC